MADKYQPVLREHIAFCRAHKQFAEQQKAYLDEVRALFPRGTTLRFKLLRKSKNYSGRVARVGIECGSIIVALCNDKTGNTVKFGFYELNDAFERGGEIIPPAGDDQ